MGVLLVAAGDRLIVEPPDTFLEIDRDVEPIVARAIPVTVQNTILSYLYWQYQDDDNLQGFVAAYNTMTQEYITWFNAINLPIYTSDTITGDLLDWVARGLYGIARPSLSSGSPDSIGPFNTWALNSLAFNGSLIDSSPDFIVTSDDIYKRCITWAFYKGDGRQFNIRWLKRRIARFILGENGGDFIIDQTYGVSVAQSGTTMTITLTGDMLTPIAPVFAQAAAAGVLELPFQFDWVIVA